MRSLLLKIFLWFWITAIATGIALIVTFVFGPGNVPAQWHSSLAETARSTGMIAIEELERGGAPAASAYLSGLEHETRLRACLFDMQWQPIAGRDCETFSDMRRRPPGKLSPQVAVRYGLVRVALTLPDSAGHQYIFATELPAGPRAAFGPDRPAIALRFGVAFIVSGFICYLLTLYLTTPILRLREAAQKIAAGDLSTRAPESEERRHDELGALVRDFNFMADRIGELISRQRQLIYDISHELRSPLARIHVALDLGRERKGDDPAFDHMERDLERLNETIGRLLTLAKLDTNPQAATMEPLDLTEVTAQVLRDAGFEAQARNVTVSLQAEERCRVRGNAQLLHSAIENVVRNAIRYTDPGTQVEVVLHGDRSNGISQVSLSVRDHGPGVPEAELASIFRPFYRVAEARDRQSGGVGLGLAIAERVIQAHSGTIRAENVAPHGLRIEILLPALT
jgi:two-component system, OmpR family, sensor histidine kinase CpxA